LVTGENEEKYPGQFQQQMMQSIGLKTDRVPSEEQRIRALARHFNRERGILPGAEFYHGDYFELENALRLGNQREQRRALDELLKKKPLEAIVQHWIRWARAPFTGQVAREADFLGTLNREQVETYFAAQAERERLARAAVELLQATTTSTE